MRKCLWLALCLVSLFGQVGCGSLPTIVPDLAVSAEPSVQLEGARGPLSSAQSKAVLERLRSRSPETGIFDRHLALEEAIVGSPARAARKPGEVSDPPLRGVVSDVSPR